MLVRLLGSPHRVVPVDVLAEDVWEGAPPSAAASTLQSHISTLRQLLGADRLSFGEGGYRIRVETAELDTLLFEADIAQGRAEIANGSISTGLEALDRGLGRWRGSAFADVAGAGWTLTPGARLSEQRNAAVEETMEARLRLGRHDEVCLLGQEAVAAEPLRERRWAILMLSFYRAGRQADALRCYQRARNTLREELGIEPSLELARLENNILLQSEALAWTGRHTVVSGVAPVLVHAAEMARTNLPAPVSNFIGRGSELTELDKLMGAHRCSGWLTPCWSGPASRT